MDHEAKHLISSIVAANRFDITNDYVSLLARRKKIAGVFVDRMWYVEPGSLEAFLQNVKVEQVGKRAALAAKLKEEYKARAALRVASEKILAQKSSVLPSGTENGPAGQTFAPELSPSFNNVSEAEVQSAVAAPVAPSPVPEPDDEQPMPVPEEWVPILSHLHLAPSELRMQPRNVSPFPNVAPAFAALALFFVGSTIGFAGGGVTSQLFAHTSAQTLPWQQLGGVVASLPHFINDSMEEKLTVMANAVVAHIDNTAPMPKLAVAVPQHPHLAINTDLVDGIAHVTGNISTGIAVVGERSVELAAAWSAPKTNSSSHVAAVSLAPIGELFCGWFALFCPEEEDATVVVEISAEENPIVPVGPQPEVTIPNFTTGGTRNNTVMEPLPVISDAPTITQVVGGVTWLQLQQALADLRVDILNSFSVNPDTYVTRSLFDKQVRTIYDAIGDSDDESEDEVAATQSVSVLSELTDVSLAAPAYGNLLMYNGTAWVNVATSSLGIVGGGGSDVWEESGSDIYYNDGNVGIGTSSPYAKLSVTGQVVGEYFSATSTTATSTFAGAVSINYTPDANVYAQSLMIGNVSGQVGDVNNEVIIGSSAANRTALRVMAAASQSADIFKVTDQFGNGYFTIASNGSPSFGSTLQVNAINWASSNHYTLENTGSDWRIRNASNSSVPLYITSGAKLGLSTSSPNNILDIYSTTKSALGFSGASGDAYKWTIGQDVSDGGKFKISSSTALGTSDRFVIDGNGSVGIGTTSPYAKLSVVGETVASYFTATTTTATSTFAGGLVLAEGDSDVGIGLTSPTAKLNVRGEVGQNLFLVEDASGNDALTIGPTGDWTAIVGGFRPSVSSSEIHTVIRPDLNYIGMLSDHQLVWRNVSTGSFFSSGAIDTGLSRFGAGVLAIGNGGTAGDTSGTLLANSIGVGTTSPYAKLSVAGQVVGAYFTATTSATSTFAGPIQASCFSTDGSTCLTAGGGSLPYYASTTIGGGTAATGLTISGNATSTGVFRSANGSESAPAYSFINDTNTGIDLVSGGILGFVIDGVGHAALNSNNFYPYTNDATALGIANGAWSDLFLASGGFIDWGNNNVRLTQSTNTLTLSSGDTLVLDYASTTVLSATTLCISTDCRTSWPSGSSLTGTLGQVAYFSGTDTAVGTSSLYIAAAGNVGIGTTSPYAKLSVAGQIVGAYFTATSTSATSTFLGSIEVGTTASTSALTVSGTALVQKLTTRASTDQNTAVIGPTGESTGFAFQGSSNNKIGVVISGSQSYQFSTAGFFGGSNNIMGFASTNLSSGWNHTVDTSFSRLSAGVVGIGTGSAGETDGTLIARNIGVGTSTPYANLTVWGSGSGRLFEIVNVASTSIFSISDSAASSSVNFNAPVLSTGSSVARTLAERFSEVINVHDFGAVGDSTGTGSGLVDTATDDTAAIQAAIDYGASLGRSFTLQFEARAYKITSELDFTGVAYPITIQGRGRGTILAPTPYGATSSVIHIGDDMDKTTIRDLRIARTVVNKNHPIGIMATSGNMIIDGVHISSLGNTGIYLSGTAAFNTEINRVDIHNSGYQPMRENITTGVTLTTTSGSPVVTASASAFDAGDVGEVIYIRQTPTDTKPSNSGLVAVIQSVDSATQVTLDRNAFYTGSSRVWSFDQVHGAITATDSTLDLNGAHGLDSNDIGRYVYVEGAGPDGEVLVTTIASLPDSDTIELAQSADITQSDARVWFTPSIFMGDVTNGAYFVNDVVLSQVNIEQYIGPAMLFNGGTNVHLYAPKYHGVVLTTENFGKSSSALVLSSMRQVTIDGTQFEFGAHGTSSGYLAISGDRPTVSITNSTVSGAIHGGYFASFKPDDLEGHLVVGNVIGTREWSRDAGFINTAGGPAGVENRVSVTGHIASGDLANEIATSTFGTVNIRGNVGIGTSSPYAKLSVAGQVVASYVTATSSTASSFAGGLTAYASTTIGGGTTATGLTISGGATTTGAFNILASGSFTIAADGATGDTDVINFTGSRAAFGYNGTLSAAVVSGGAGKHIVFNVGGLTSERARFTSTGEFGFGTSTPFAKFGIHALSGETNRTIFAIASSTASATSTLFSILNTGNVGIGTTSPYARLSVEGEVVAQKFTATSTTATSTIAGGLTVGSGAINYDFSSGLTTIQNLAFGSMSFETDAGIVSWFDMPVTSSASAGTIESYTASIDGTSILTVYGESNGSGGVQNTRAGVGTTTPWRTFSVNGTVSFAGLTTNTGGVTSALCLDANNQVTQNTDNETCVASSERYKHNITPLSPASALTILNGLEPVTFEYNNATGTVRFGLIAEQVELIEDRLVSYDDLNRPQAVRYTDIIPLLIQGIKDLYATVTGFANKFTTRELCLEDVCVTKEQLLALLEAADIDQHAQIPSSEEEEHNENVATTTPPIMEDDSSTSTPATSTPPVVEKEEETSASSTPATNESDEEIVEEAELPEEVEAPEEQTEEPAEEVEEALSVLSEL